MKLWLKTPYGNTASDAFGLASKRGIMPTWMGTAELRDLATDIRERAVFSARTTHAKYLQTLREKINKIIEGGYGSTHAEIRLALKEELRELAYNPLTGFPGDEALGIPPAEPGSLQDLSSDRRLDLIISTQMQLLAGKGQEQRGLEPAALDLFPAYELLRVREVRVPREWIMRWQTAADNVDWQGVSKAAFKMGRMVALKASPIWPAIGSSALFDDALDVSHPPFAFQSGVGWGVVAKDEALEMDLDVEAKVPAKTLKQAQALPPAAASTAGLDADFLAELKAKVTGIEQRDGKLTLGGSVKSAVERALEQRKSRLNALFLALDVTALRLRLNAGTHAGALKGWITRRRQRAQIRAGRDALKAAVQGEKNVERAMQVPGLGWIDFLWGARGAKSMNKQGATHWGGWGIHHIHDKRGEKAIAVLPIILAKGEISLHEEPEKRYVKYAGWSAVVKKRQSGHWSMTTLIDDDVKPKRLSPAK